MRPFLQRLNRNALYIAASTALCGLLLSGSAPSAHAQLVISQFYGGGGNSGATYNQDFVELFNGTGAAINLSGYTLQYAAATNANTTLAAGNVFALTFASTTTIASGKFFLIATGPTSSTNGVNFPVTADATAGANLSGTAGKLFLASNNNPVSAAIGSNTPATESANVVDFVGFGNTAGNLANAYEGSGPAPTLSVTTSALRNNNGSTYVDTNNNAADFMAVLVNSVGPRNSASLSPFGGGANTPEPGTLPLLGMGLLTGASMVGTVRRRKAKKQA